MKKKVISFLKVDQEECEIFEHRKGRQIKKILKILAHILCIPTQEYCKFGRTDRWRRRNANRVRFVPETHFIDITTAGATGVRRSLYVKLRYKLFVFVSVSGKRSEIRDGEGGTPYLYINI